MPPKRKVPEIQISEVAVSMTAPSEHDHESKLLSLQQDMIRFKAQYHQEMTHLVLKVNRIETKYDNLKKEYDILTNSLSSLTSNTSNTHFAPITSVHNQAVSQASHLEGSKHSQASLSEAQTSISIHERPVAAYNKDTDALLRIFPNKKVAAASLGISQAKIEGCIRRNDAFGQMKWKYHSGDADLNDSHMSIADMKQMIAAGGEILLEPIKLIDPKPKSYNSGKSGEKPKRQPGRSKNSKSLVEAFNLATNQRLRIFTNVKDAASKLALTQLGITETCLNKRTECGNLGWRFYTGPDTDIAGMENTFVPVHELLAIVSINAPREKIISENTTTNASGFLTTLAYEEVNGNNQVTASSAQIFAAAAAATKKNHTTDVTVTVTDKSPSGKKKKTDNVKGSIVDITSAESAENHGSVYIVPATEDKTTGVTVKKINDKKKKI